MEQAAYGLTAPVTSDKWRVASEEEAKRDGKEAAWQLPSIRPRDQETKRPEGGQGAKGERQEVRGKGSDGKAVEIHMLVGTRFWFMAAFALVSLQRQVGRPVHVHFYDDGTLEARQREKLGTLASAVTFHDRAGIDARIEQYLPEDRFPSIRERLRHYPNLKKLTDPHVASTGPKLVMDADVLFFGEPDELLRWWDNPINALCATDVTESYGYSRPLMQKLAGAPIPRDINVGITGLRSETIDWEQLENWCRELITREKTNYYLEQALVAMICAQKPYTQLGLARYITGPSDRQVLNGEGVMQHYVDLSKREYFRNAWKRLSNES